MALPSASADAASASAQARKLLAVREERLHELEALLRSRTAEAKEPAVQRALTQVEEALAAGSKVEASPKTPSVPRLRLPSSSCGDTAAEDSAARALSSHRHSVGLDSALSTCKGVASPQCGSGLTPRVSSGGLTPRVSLGLTPRGSCSGLTPRGSLTPRSPRSSQSLRSCLQSPQTRSLATLGASARAPGVASACRELEELLAAAPARAAGHLRAGLLKLLGELTVLEQRQQTQAKAGEELRTGLSKLPPPSHSERKLRECEAEYRGHIERLSAKDKSTARSVVDSSARAEAYEDRTSEALLEVERLRQERARRAGEADRVTEQSAKLTELKATIEAKALLLAQLEEQLPMSHRILEEHQALSRRFAKLTSENQ